MYFSFKHDPRASYRPSWGNIIFLWHVPTCSRPASGDPLPRLWGAAI